MNNKYLLFVLFIGFYLTTFNLNAQNKDNFKAGFYNIGIGGFVGGVGAIINKKKNEKTGNVFLKGFGQGALGGYLIYESKRLVGKFGETGDYKYVWPSKLINSAGASIIENAAANRNLWERWHLNFGFNRLEYNTNNEKNKVSYRVMPFALINTIYGFSKGKLDINKSLKIGSPVFVADIVKGNKSLEREAITIANSIILKRNSLFSKNLIESHEIIHVYQYENFSAFNPFLEKTLMKFNSKNWYNLYDKIFYTDFNYLIRTGLYYINSNSDSNLFEKEARYYTEFN